MGREHTKEDILAGNTSLGIEFGSTRIKAVLIGSDHTPIASGSYDWENKLVDNIWSYDLDEIWTGLQKCYKNLTDDVRRQYDLPLVRVGIIGFSAMMHGYMPFDKEGKLLVPFRTWRNNMTGQATQVLTPLFGQHIPQRWSIAHLYQAVLNEEPHVAEIDYVATLAAYVHWKMTGKRVLGIGDASGMFPIDSVRMDYHQEMLDQFDALIDGAYPWKIRDILPKVAVAGEDCGVLTPEGAKLLDPTGTLQPGILLCAPEGDAGTGMTATNSVAKRTGNISAGTSIFAMLVLEKSLSRLYEEIDLVTTPDGSPVAMVHAQNCTSDLNAWVNLFRENLELFGLKPEPDELYGNLYRQALKADADCGGLLSYGYFSGEHITHFEEGRPLFVRMPESKLSLANFMKTHLCSALGVIKIGMDILAEREGVVVEKILGHGGLFKTPGVGDRIMADALNTPVAVMETAGEGGAWGIALLAAYTKNKTEGESLAAYLQHKVFVHAKSSLTIPEAAGVSAFADFMLRYKEGLAIEKAAVEHLNSWRA